MAASLGYSTDTAYDRTLARMAPSDADLIVHEAEQPWLHTGVHTLYAQLAALPPSRAPRQVRLTHYPDDFDAASNVIEVLRQGQCYVI